MIISVGYRVNSKKQGELDEFSTSAENAQVRLEGNNNRFNNEFFDYVIILG